MRRVYKEEIHLKCHWKCECGVVNDCPTGMNDYLEEKELHLLSATKKGYCDYFCKVCHKRFSPYEVPGLIHEEVEKKAKTW